MEPLEHDKKVVERVLKRLCEIVDVNDIQFGFTPEERTIDAVFLLRGFQEA